MKKIHLLNVSILISSFIFGQQNNLELLYQWADDGTVLTADNPGDNWVGNIYNEIWGFVQNDHEFAVIGTTQGTHIFDVTDPVNSYLAGTIDGGSTSPDVVHRDFHTFNGYLYAVADEMSTSTLQIIDLSNLPSAVELIYDSNEIITRAHNIFIDEENAIMYVCGGRVNGSSNYLSLLSLDDPENPLFLTSYETHGYIHDIYVENNIGYLNAANNGFHIVDFSDFSSPQTLGSLTDYPFQGYNHSGWLSEDGNTYVFADENHGYRMKVCDVSNPNDINVVSMLLSDVQENSIPHNLIIQDNLLYVSHYYDGLWIWDISNPESPSYVASYDTYPLSSGNSYKGAWGVYPLLPSGNILVSDMQYGLFVFAPPQNSININEAKNNAIIFPNPCNDILNINNLQESAEELKLYDVYGNLVFEKLIKNSFKKINTEFLSSGVYLLSINGPDIESKYTIIKY